MNKLKSILLFLSFLLITSCNSLNSEIADAIINGDNDILKMALLNGSINPDLKGEYGINYLQLASSFGNIEAINLLIKNGADINIRDYDGCTPIFHAVVNEQYQAIETLLRHKAKINDYHFYGFTPLSVAAEMNIPQMVQFLISKGANVNFCNPGGQTALIRASFNNYPKITEMLLKNGANVDTYGMGETALLYASRNLNGKGVETLAVLLKHNANINAFNSLKFNALIIAINQGDYNVAKFLVENNINLNHQNKYKRTALDLAIIHKKHDIMALLQKHGAKTSNQLKKNRSHRARVEEMRLK